MPRHTRRFADWKIQPDRKGGSGHDASMVWFPALSSLPVNEGPAGKIRAKNHWLFASINLTVASRFRSRHTIHTHTHTHTHTFLTMPWRSEIHANYISFRLSHPDRYVLVIVLFFVRVFALVFALVFVLVFVLVCVMCICVCMRILMFLCTCVRVSVFLWLQFFLRACVHILVYSPYLFAARVSVDKRARTPCLLIAPCPQRDFSERNISRPFYL